jgi:nitrate reductase delta subunit
MNRTDVLAWQTQSLLLDYPDGNLAGRLDLLDRIGQTLPRPVSVPLRRFLDRLTATSPAELARDYVATFDNRKRCCLYLTYYAHGDTRKRGMALLGLKQTYAGQGWRLADEELPDHLCVMLEFAAACPDAGRALLIEYRAGLELLRLALHEAASPWADVVDSVSATLPTLGGDERTAIARLVAQGPPAEQVGLAPFAPPEYMPQHEGGRP